MYHHATQNDAGAAPSLGTTVQFQGQVDSSTSQSSWNPSFVTALIKDPSLNPILGRV